MSSSMNGNISLISFVHPKWWSFYLNQKLLIKTPNSYSKIIKPHTWFDFVVETMTNDYVIIQQNLKLTMKTFKYRKKRVGRNPKPNNQVLVRVKRSRSLQIDKENTYSLAHQNQFWSWFPSYNNLVFFLEPPTSFSLCASPRLFQKLSMSTPNHFQFYI